MILTCLCYCLNSASMRFEEFRRHPVVFEMRLLTLCEIVGNQKAFIRPNIFASLIDVFLWILASIAFKIKDVSNNTAL